MKAYHQAANYLAERLNGRRPRIAITLGSGLGALADDIKDPLNIPYADIPGFPQSTVHGHKGQLVFGELGGQFVACMQGRFHVYEGHKPESLQIPIRALRLLGVELLVLTNAAGSIHEAMGPGSLMLIEDHINFSGVNPLLGGNDDDIGPRFPDMTEAYNKHQGVVMQTAAGELGIELFRGTYLWALGPSFETPAEIRLYRQWGADAVGMSTVPETIVARHCGMDVVAVSSITNLCAGMTGQALTHEETLREGAKAAEKLSRLIKRWLEAQ
ncbi:purine-nucleoside phosphorylase [Salinispirillum marinum]|uniref:Purine nucleoside phosphorylase n=2 Tax=Saccharospirillaceae TaxID=255527 RepID=A0ABV8BHY3_9GAMM